MTTYTANHLFVTTILACISGPYSGEEAVWGTRWTVGSSAGRPGLDEGSVGLNTFDVHSANKARSLTASTVVGSLTQPWEGENVPIWETISDNDIDFHIQEAVKFFEGTKAYLPNTWQMQSVRVYPVGEDGKAPAGPVVWIPDAAYKGSGTQLASPELACCVSLYTATRNKHGRGRIYFGPVSTNGLGTDGLLSAGLITALGTFMRAWQNNVRTRGTPGLSATYAGIVWNRTNKTQGCVINRVRVGDEIDRQERRTKDRPETFVNWSVT